MPEELIQKAGRIGFGDFNKAGNFTCQGVFYGRKDATACAQVVFPSFLVHVPGIDHRVGAVLLVDIIRESG